jgi:BirA family transcriptional regulator, biotin operon repressor / biotin---[acetyl-CoA-carboxylase] ligase
VIVADSQRTGRGSRGRAWVSPGGVDLYLSIVDRPKLSPAHRPLLSLAAGLGVAYAAQSLIGNEPQTQVKWPNDLWIERRKCAGILIESASRERDAVVIGIGLNLNRVEWPDELSENATSLLQATGRDHRFDRTIALALLLKEVEAWVDRLVALGPKPVVTAIEQRLALKGALVSCAEVQGHLMGIAENGAAQISTSEGIVEVVAGTLRPLL